MSKRQKSLSRIFATPVPADVTWREIRALLIASGYEERSGGGSARKFVHPELKAVFTCHAPHPEPTVGRGLLRDLREHLTAYGLGPEAENA